MSENPANLIEELDRAIGTNLKAARESSGLSQAELAQKAQMAGITNFHQTTVARIEAGTRALRASEGVALARVLGTSLESLAESNNGARLRELLNDANMGRIDLQSAIYSFLKVRGALVKLLDELAPIDKSGVALGSCMESSGLDPEVLREADGQIARLDLAAVIEAEMKRQVVDPDKKVIDRLEGQGTEGAEIRFVYPVPRENIRARRLARADFELLGLLEGLNGEHPEAP